MVENRILSKSADGVHNNSFALGENLLDWSGCKIFGHMSALEMVGCVHRWPESLSGASYSVGCYVL